MQYPIPILNSCYDKIFSLFQNSVFHLSDRNNNMDGWLLFHCLLLWFVYVEGMLKMTCLEVVPYQNK